MSNKKRTGHPQSEEARRKISEANKGKVMSEETRRKISEAQRGKPGHPQTEETRQKISEKMKGRPASEYTKQRASETHKGKVTSDETKKKMAEAKKKPVQLTNIQTGEVFIYNSRKEAEEAQGFYKNRITYIIRYQHGRSKDWFIETL